MLLLLLLRPIPLCPYPLCLFWSMEPKTQRGARCIRHLWSNGSNNIRASIRVIHTYDYKTRALHKMCTHKSHLLVRLGALTVAAGRAGRERVSSRKTNRKGDAVMRGKHEIIERLPSSQRMLTTRPQSQDKFGFHAIP